MVQNTDVKKSFRWKRKRILIPGAFLLFIAVILLFLPFCTKYYLQKWLVENGAESASIEKVRLNLLTGVAALDGVEVTRDGKTVFSNATIFINIGLQQLFKKEAHLQGVQLTDVNIDIEQGSDGVLRVGSYNLETGKQSIKQEQEETKEEVKERLGWIFGASEVKIENVKVHYLSEEVDVTLVIEHAAIENFNTDPNIKQGTFFFEGSVNGAPISIKLSRFEVLPDIELEGEVELSQFDLGVLEKFLENAVAPFKGIAGLKGKVLFTMESEKGLEVDYDGMIDLAESQIGGAAWGTNGTVGWSGKVRFSMNDEEMIVTTDGDLRGQPIEFTLVDPMININESDLLISGRTEVTIAEQVVVDTGASLILAPLTYSMDSMQSSTGQSSWAGDVRVETGTESKGLTVKADGKLEIGDPQYSMDVDSKEMAVANKSLSYNGAFEYLAASVTESTSYIRTDGEFLGELTDFVLPETITIKQGRLALNGKTEIVLNQDVAVNYDGDIVLDDTGVSLPTVTVGDKQVSWSGAIGFVTGEKKQAVTLKGGLEAQKLFASLQDAGIEIQQGLLEGDADLTLDLGDKLGIDGTAELGTKELLVIKDQAQLVSVAETKVQGFEGTGSSGIALDELNVEGVQIPASDLVPTPVSIKTIQLQGLQSPDFLSGKLKRFTVVDPVVTAADSDTVLASVGNVEATDLSVDENLTADVGGLVLSKAAFLVELDSDPLAKLKAVSVDGITYSTTAGLEIQTVELDSLVGSFVMQKGEGEEKETDSTVTESDQETAQSEQQDQVAEEEAAKGAPVIINTIKLVGESIFSYSDTTLSQPFETNLVIDTLELEKIDLNKPEQPFTYLLKGTFDKYAPLKISGSCAPFAKALMIDQEVSLMNYSLPHVSPYVVEAIGTHFIDGRLDYGSSLKLSGDEIDMKNNLKLKDVDSETIDGELSERLDNQLPIPLDMAFAMLTDNDGTIDLDVPIRGRLSELNVGLGDLIITTLGKGITVAVAPYLAYTFLGPTGALVYAGVKVGQALMNTDLPVMKFSAGDINLNEAHLATLAKVGEAIVKDKTQSYSICARVSVSELENYEILKGQLFTRAQKDEFGKELYQLAETRSLMIRKYLVETFKIEEERLLICNPSVDFTGEEQPKVEFKQ